LGALAGEEDDQVRNLFGSGESARGGIGSGLLGNPRGVTARRTRNGLSNAVLT